MLLSQTTGKNKAMTAKEVDELIIRLYTVMNPVHRKYNQDLEGRNLNRAHDLCEMLTIEEKRAVRYMLLCDRDIGMNYLRKHHKFIVDREVSQDGSLNCTIRNTVYEYDEGGEVGVVEKEAKNRLLNIFPMI